MSKDDVPTKTEKKSYLKGLEHVGLKKARKKEIFGKKLRKRKKYFKKHSFKYQRETILEENEKCLLDLAFKRPLLTFKKK